MEVSEGNQNRGEKFNNSRIYLVQLSLSETQVHIRLHKVYSKCCHYIMQFYTNYYIISITQVTLTHL